VALALEGFRVLDLAQGISGPTCAMQLGDLGAVVIKIEPMTGDWLREIGPFHQPGGESELFLQLNRNKRGIALDLKTDAGKEILARLVAAADIIIEGYRPGVMQRLGFDYETLQAKHPRLIYCSITGNGTSGPLADAPVTEIDTQARTGLNRHLSGPDKPPVRFGLDLASMGAAMAAFHGVMTALLWRERTGEGQHVETSLLAAQVSLLQWDLNADQARQRRVYTDLPDEGFATADGPVLVQMRGLDGWHRLLKALGREDLVQDERFASAPINAPTLAAALKPQLAAMPYEDVRTLVEDQLSGTIVRMNDFKSLLYEPQVAAVGNIVEVEGHKTAGSYKTLDVPWGFIDEPLSALRLPAPVLGQHTAEVLRELGYDDAAISRLASDNVIRLAG